MGFLAKIFESRREKDLILFITSLQQDKIRLEEENKQLKEKLFKFIDNITDKKENNKEKEKKYKLSPIEKKIVNFIEKEKKLDLKQIKKKFNLKENSLKVYISRIKNKKFLKDFFE